MISDSCDLVAKSVSTSHSVSRAIRENRRLDWRLDEVLARYGRAGIYPDLERFAPDPFRQPPS